MNVTYEGIELDFEESLIDEPVHEIRRQLEEYERGERTQFDLGVSIPESFTGAVMAAMIEIPYGQTRTYGEVADQVNSSPIAVGQACGRNPVPIVVPCHRVVGKNSLGGFSAGGDRNMDLKQALLAHERAGTEPAQTRLSTHL